MQTDKIELISNIIDSKSSRLRESYFINNYSSVYNEIISFCKEISDISFIQKLWHYVNNIPNYYLCDCGKKTSFNRNWKEGYRKTCSPKCAQSNLTTKEKRLKTNLEKYGVSNVSKLDNIKQRISNTNIEKYGYKSSFQNKDVRNKWINSIKEKYGEDHYFKTQDFKIKSKKYYLEKYGVDHPLKIDDVKQKIKDTCLTRYGVETYLNTIHSRDSIKSYNRSSKEIEIFEWVKSIASDANHSNREIIYPLLLDIYIPSRKLAIEFNGLWWHSEFHKEKDYHLKKTLLCKEKGVSLIHIWEDDWVNRKDVIKSIISNKIGTTSNKIGARKCIIKDVNNRDTSEFLNKNHMQGYTKFSDSIGLYYNNELISLMCFGWRGTNGKREYELIRFCNKLNFNIIGGASKLFNYFVNNNLEIDSIVSYADISIFDGNIYNSLGFLFSRRSEINYWWVVNGIRKHRFNYNKKKLVKMGYDQLKTEVEIMHELKNYRIFGCGQDKWIWNRNI
jgi:hypothetical protein